MSPTAAAQADRRTPIRVGVADDHPVVRIGVRNVLAAHGNFSVIGEAETGTEATALARDLHPDVLLLDIQMPHSSGFETVRQIVQAVPETRVLLLTGSIQAEQLAEAFTAGARGVVLKNALTDQIAVAIFTVFDGYYWADGRRIEHLAGVLGELKQQVRQESNERFNLTRRELEVVGLIVKGYSNRDIAQDLKLSEETVKRHLSNTFEKLDISTRLELAIFAISHKLVSPKDAPST